MERNFSIDKYKISIKNLLGYSNNKLELEFINKSDNSIILKTNIELILK